MMWKSGQRGTERAPWGAPAPPRLCRALQGQGPHDPGPKDPGLDGLLAVRTEPCRPPNYHVGWPRPARRHQEGGRRVSAAARDRPETAPAAADTYLTRQASAAETPPRGAPAHAPNSNPLAPLPGRPAASTSGSPPLGPKVRLILGRATGLEKGWVGATGKPAPRALCSFLLTP